MVNHSKQFQINAGFIAQQSIGYSRVFQINLPEVFLQPDLELNNLIGEVEITRINEGLLSQGQFKAEIDSVCCRCLIDIKEEIQTEFKELFIFESQKQDDSELSYPDDGMIDFGPIVREYLILEININPVCMKHCKGLCSICGNNKNTDPCTHEHEPDDPRLSILRNLLDDK